MYVYTYFITIFKKLDLDIVIVGKMYSIKPLCTIILRMFYNIIKYIPN